MLKCKSFGPSLATSLARLTMEIGLSVDLDYEMLVRFAEEASCLPKGDVPQIDDRRL